MKSTQSEDSKMSLIDTYKIAIEARNFHYEHFNKWMTFFYVAVAAVFVVFSNSQVDKNIRLLLPLVGFLISILWYLSCKGYYYWIKNWAYQLKRFEDQFPENQKIYSSFSETVKENHNNLYKPLESANISTSKLILLFSFIICLGWGYFVTITLITEFAFIQIGWYFLLIISSLTTYLITIVIGYFLSSNMKEHKIVKT